MRERETDVAARVVDVAGSICVCGGFRMREGQRFEKLRIVCGVY